MFTPPDPEHRVDRSLVLALLVLVLFASPAAMLWTSADSPWYVAYLMWLGVILLGAWLQQGRHHDDP